MTTRPLTALLTALAMVAFATNSLLCRLALSRTAIDAAAFTALRLGAGAVFLGLLVLARPGPPRRGGGSLAGAAFLTVYAAAFSFAYRELPTGVGALLLFGAVQLTMLGWALGRGERFGRRRASGVVVAILGLAGLTLPGASAPPPIAAALMLAAGVAWGAYSLLGRGAPEPMRTTAGNFVRAAPLGVAVVGALGTRVAPPLDGALLAVVSGALASGLGYVVWYTALRGLTATEASVVQLSVPVLAALLGVVVLGEAPSLRLLGAGLTILLGIGLSLGGAASAPARVAEDRRSEGANAQPPPADATRAANEVARASSAGA